MDSNDKLELEKIINYVFQKNNAEGFATRLTKTESDKIPEDADIKRWKSIKDYESGQNLLNAYHSIQNDIKCKAVKQIILDNQTMTNALYATTCNTGCKIRVDEFLFYHNYWLKIDPVINNKIMLAIHSLLTLKGIMTLNVNNESAPFLFEALSEQKTDENHAMHILIKYANELIKTIDNTDYKSELIALLEIASFQRDFVAGFRELSLTTFKPYCLYEEDIEKNNAFCSDSIRRLYKSTIDKINK